MWNSVGDIESAVYLEAMQQFQFRVGRENFLMVHLGMVPVIGATGEPKTKPCQHSVKTLREAGVKPDLLMCRSERPVDAATRQELSLFCQVQPECVISLHDISNLYRVPLLLAEQSVGKLICEHLKLREAAKMQALCCGAVAPILPLEDAALPPGARHQRLGDWMVLADRPDRCKDEVSVALVGKYTGNPDAYVSIVNAPKHAALESGLRLNLISGWTLRRWSPGHSRAIASATRRHGRR